VVGSAEDETLKTRARSKRGTGKGNEGIQEGVPTPTLTFSSSVFSLTCGRSILLRTTTCGFEARTGLKRFSS